MSEEQNPVAMTFRKGSPGRPLPPQFSSLEEERTHRKQKLVAGFRLFSKYGFDEGVAGHITMRDPIQTDHFWVNPFGVDFGQICVRDLLLVNAAGEVIEGDYPLNNAAFAIHSAIHRARPEVVAVAHAHSMYGKVWSTLGRLLDPITQDSCAFFQDHSIFENYSGVVYESSEGQRIADSLGSGKACILANHGLLTVGKSVEEAVWWFISMERCCQCQLLAESVGKPHPIPGHVAALTKKQIGSTYSGWFSPQPMFHKIEKEQPDIKT